jgi:predicted metal-dependent phosphoesterase TrpH
MQSDVSPENDFSLVALPWSRIISTEEAYSLAYEGWLASDLHVHTCFSEDVLTLPCNAPEALYGESKKRGLAYISFTDHDTMDAYDRIGWEREGLIPGVEIRILDKKAVGHTIHVNVYLLDKWHCNELLSIARKKRCLELFLEFLREHALPHTYNHPFWFEAGEKPHLEVVPEIAALFPALEYNRGRVARINRLAVSLAEKTGKGIVACSDSHSFENLGIARTYSKGKDFRQYFGNICKGNAYILPHDLTAQGLTQEVNEWICKIFEYDSTTIAKPFAGAAGRKRLDLLLNMFGSTRFFSVPWLKGTMRSLLHLVSNSGVIQYLYVQSQNSLALQIERQLNLT